MKLILVTLFQHGVLVERSAHQIVGKMATTDLDVNKDTLQFGFLHDQSWEDKENMRWPKIQHSADCEIWSGKVTPRLRVLQPWANRVNDARTC